MRCVALVAVVLATASRAQDSASPYFRADQSEARQRDLVGRLEQGLRLRLSNVRRESAYKEATCGRHWNFWSLAHTQFVSVTELVDVGEVDFNLTVQTEQIRRVDNDQRSGSVQLNTQKGSITVDSTTSGWNIGGQVNGGFWSPYTGNMGGVTISGGYSRSTTTTTEKTLSEGTVSQCEARYSCWTEAWTVKLTFRGPCRTEETLRDDRGHDVWSTRQCPAATSLQDWPSECLQWAEWKSKACRRTRAARECTVETPLLESDGKTPFHLEVAFRLPILSLWERPEITGYRAGRYLLRAGEHGYTEYDPDRRVARYLDAGHGWHYYEAYPDLDGQVRDFKHPHPAIRAVENRCYDLDSDEWYCPDRAGKDKFYTQSKGYYAKPGAPEPTFEEMDRADRKQWYASPHKEDCRHDGTGLECAWFATPPACGTDPREVGAVDVISDDDTSVQMTYLGKYSGDDREQCERLLGKGSRCCERQRRPCKSGFWRLWCAGPVGVEAGVVSNEAY
ncbi:uncharacterized protein MAM_06432 [Metarhizium album ARSEF 1941]|uniref:Uncharacterized protein n=1 Tax=Metarhizium album (strain ARSEF 1941) TaxID=1081103 RepID=A0A0B2WS95_METAS|nr:uncharacterized protein MAM_06432 [Metarhizium album ARSEF 1941]KHN95820.1 hypothetical protein MAM_06432 [Metarhizium album ARSEF 1941]